MRDRLVRRLLPAGVLLLVAVAWLMPEVPGLDLDTAETGAVDAWEATLDGLPSMPLVLVAFDPDVGTYAEIRPTVRAALAELLARDARLAFFSLTPEGRALALAEMDRLRAGEANPRRWADLGFAPGAEAAIVELSRSVPVPDDAGGEIARRLGDGGADAIDALVVIGGNEIGPRSWVEQLLPRIEATPALAVAPTVLLPELLPYAESGQLDALLATPGDGAAYRSSVSVGRLDRFLDASPPRALPVLVGLVLALGVVGVALVRSVSADRGNGGSGAQRAREAEA